MTPLPGALDGRELCVWRIETTRHVPGWQTAEGAFRVGGRWSSAGTRVLCIAADPSTAILEVAVHKGLHALDAVPHTLLEIEVAELARLHVAHPAKAPDPTWLRPGTVNAEQPAFGDALLASHPMVLIPSVVSTHSWNLLIDASAARSLFSLRRSEPFALDPRLKPVGAAARRRPRSP